MRDKLHAAMESWGKSLPEVQRQALRAIHDACNCCAANNEGLNCCVDFIVGTTNE